MLVLSRKIGDKILIGDTITIVVNRISGNRIALAIDAPADMRIVRGELAECPAVADGEADVHHPCGKHGPRQPDENAAHQPPPDPR